MTLRDVDDATVRRMQRIILIRKLWDKYPEDVREALKVQFKEVEDKGRDEGWKNGYDDGKNEGYAEGKNYGFRKGRGEGVHEGERLAASHVEGRIDDHAFRAGLGWSERERLKRMVKTGQP